jgi:hypothetical protein
MWMSMRSVVRSPGAIPDFFNLQHLQFVLQESSNLLHIYLAQAGYCHLGSLNAESPVMTPPMLSMV